MHNQRCWGLRGRCRHCVAAMHVKGQTSKVVKPVVNTVKCWCWFGVVPKRASGVVLMSCCSVDLQGVRCAAYPGTHPKRIAFTNMMYSRTYKYNWLLRLCWSARHRSVCSRSLWGFCLHLWQAAWPRSSAQFQQEVCLLFFCGTIPGQGQRWS